MSRFVIHRTPTGFHFDLKADNGETVAVSEVYTSAALCRKGIESVRRCAATEKVEDHSIDAAPLTCPKFELYADKTGHYRFRLRSRNKKVIAASEGYATKSACEKGIEAVRRCAEEATVEMI